jgi:hypothetical protein
LACLGSVLYDPTTLATGATTAALAMTAFDTTNARITFTAPSNGTVLVKIRVAEKGAATNPSTLLGVLDGATVRGRLAPLMGRQFGTNTLSQHESVALVTGLTAGQSYTWDAAYGVEFAVAATQFGWGGPNDTTASNAYGALNFEVWETPNLLAGTLYDPAAQVQKATSALLAMTALDTTNLRLTFTPTTSRALVRLACMNTGAANYPQIYLGVLESSTIRGRQAPSGGTCQMGSLAVTDYIGLQSMFVVSGLTPGTPLTWDAAYAVETVQASSNITYGGPNNGTASDAGGGFAFEIWSA